MTGAEPGLGEASPRQRWAPVFFLAAFAFLLYEGLRLLLPFGGALAFAITAGAMFHPMHAALRRRLPRLGAGATALVSDLVVLLFFIVPLGLIAWSIVREADALMPQLKDWSDRAVAWVKTHSPDEAPVVRRLPERIRGLLNLRFEAMQGRLAHLGGRVAGWITSGGAALAKHAFGLAFDAMISLLVLFFVFRDGEKLFDRSLRLLPLDPDARGRIKSRLQLSLTGVVRGVFLTSLMQGVTAAIGFLIVGCPGVFVLGFLTALASFIPSVGTVLVWLPVAAGYLVAGHQFKALFLALWGVFVVAVMDNLLRPYLVGTSSDMPFLWLFLALLGGIEVFGLVGIILGPVIFGLIAAFIEIYEERYGEREQPVED